MCWGWGEESKTSRGCHGRSGGPGAGRLTQAQVEVGDPQPRWKKTLRAPEEGSGPRRHRAGLLLPFSPWPTSHVCFGPLLPFPTHLLSSLGLHWDPSFQETFLLLSQHRHPGGPCWELWEGREGLSIFPVSYRVGMVYLNLQKSQGRADTLSRELQGATSSRTTP